VSEFSCRCPLASSTSSVSILVRLVTVRRGGGAVPPVGGAGGAASALGPTGGAVSGDGRIAPAAAGGAGALDGADVADAAGGGGAAGGTAGGAVAAAGGLEGTGAVSGAGNTGADSAEALDPAAGDGASAASAPNDNPLAAAASSVTIRILHDWRNPPEFTSIPLIFGSSCAGDPGAGLRCESTPARRGGTLPNSLHSERRIKQTTSCANTRNVTAPSGTL